jgi:hypothetical protein
MQYTKEDLSELINVKLKEVPRKVLNDIFGYKDPKTLDRKIAGTMPLTPIDQMNIDVLSDSADAGVRHLYKRGTPVAARYGPGKEFRYDFEDDGLTEIPGTGFYE